MVDLTDKRSDSEEMNNSCSDVPPAASAAAASSDSASSDESQFNEVKKICADCGTSKTPLWRGGPAGPKSLCNACGIRSRKKRRAILGFKDEKKAKRSNYQSCKSSSASKSNNNNDSNSSSKFSSSLNQRLLALGREVLMQKSNMDKKRTLGEEEQAAVLLMELSCSSVYA